MSAWLSFMGRIEPMEWGRNTYTVLRIPDEITAALQSLGAKRVDVELNDHPFNMALTKSPAISGTFVYTGKSVLQEAGVSPGEEIDVRLRKADADAVEVPSDVALAIRGAQLSDTWSALTPGKQRGLLHTINTAKRAQTRAKRIAQLVAALRA
ncbi:MAG: YdeI/OmpD-associated family protein [Pseudomonadota bacterium]